MTSYIPYKDVLYRLDGYVISDIEEAAYPEFELFHKEQILFHTIGEAETKISELVAEKSDDRYCFFIHEIPVGIHCYSSQSQCTRSYTRQGELFAVSTVSSLEDRNGCLERFHGLNQIKCRFRSGDLVEVFRGDRVTLEIICSLPVCPETSLGLEIHMDYTDDGYTTISGEDGYMQCHSHPRVVQCFPADTLPLKDEVRNTLTRGYVTFQNQ